MALPDRYGIEKKLNSMEGLSAYENGGKGSGNGVMLVVRVL